MTPPRGFLYYAKGGFTPPLINLLEATGMSTYLQEKDDHYLVSTLAKRGRQRKIPRDQVRVEKGDPAKLEAEIVRQCDLVRALLLAEQPLPRPVE